MRQSAREHLRGDLVVELEPGRLQVELVEQRPRKQLQRGDGVGEIAAGAHERREAQAAAAEIRRPRLLRIFAADSPFV